MTPDKIAEEYLRWRFQLMKAEAPAAPSAAQLIERALPWWERTPERYRALVGRLEKMQSGYDNNGGRSDHGSEGRAMPALIVRGDEGMECFARVLDFKVRDGKLHFRFKVASPFAPEGSTLEVTFISYPASRALLFAPAFGSSEIGYIVYTELPAELSVAWVSLDETAHLPFRLILRCRVRSTS